MPLAKASSAAILGGYCFLYSDLRAAATAAAELGLEAGARRAGEGHSRERRLATALPGGTIRRPAGKDSAVIEVYVGRSAAVISI